MTTFTGKILNDGDSGLATSPFAETNWDNTNPSLPAQNPSAWVETAIDTSTDNAEPQVMGFKIAENNWT